MTQLKHVEIGQRFRFAQDGLVWIKDSVQGMNNMGSRCHTEKAVKVKGYEYPRQKQEVFLQEDTIYEILN
jgi:hypothetical protein